MSQQNQDCIDNDTPLMHAQDLPIFNIIPELQYLLRKHSLVLLTAEPGAGKTTQIPLSLSKEPWLQSKKIILLEPRRLAARTAAFRMAALVDQPVGEMIGYRTRLDSKIGSHTQIEIVTEGILTRILQHDPSLHDYGLVIFDEFHERNLQADLGLALTLQTQSLFREDLRILIMSATLDNHGLSQTFKQAPMLTCSGSMFPIETRYIDSFDAKNFTQQVSKTILSLLNTEPGNILVFLPGSGEIRRIAEQLTQGSLPAQTHLSPLYGNLSPQAQDQAILPPLPGWRKVVLSTNIAETSLTIEGIRIVLDTGLMRIPQFDVRSGMSRLITIHISQASATQRQGRAGRLEPGLCIRCWSKTTQRTLLPRIPPEILDTDLTSLALELAIWGIQDPSELSWIDPPPAGALAHARRLLRALGAINMDNHVTPHGQQMAELPTHPRLPHMIIQGATLQQTTLACDLAALLHERELMKALSVQEPTDLRNQMEEYLRQSHHKKISGVAHRIRETSHRWQRILRSTSPPPNNDLLLTRLAFYSRWHIQIVLPNDKAMEAIGTNSPMADSRVFISQIH